MDMVKRISTAARFARARQDFAASAEGIYSRYSRHFLVLALEPVRRGEAAEDARWALAAGEKRIAELAGTEHEQAWRDAIAQFRTVVREWGRGECCRVAGTRGRICAAPIGHEDKHSFVIPTVRED